MKDIVVGIDLGTTNSEIAAYHEGKVRILSQGNSQMLPSCVGLTPGGELLVGQAARNQQLLYPDRTIRSIKRKMGSGQAVTLGDKTFSPQDISALILRELARWAGAKLGGPVTKAIITVPAYFSDAQRQATREAGELAGLDVIRLINEPTAASLAYGYGESSRQTVMIYDLGGGTFDVSIVNIQDQVTEVVASHGNNQLGGDDFDQLLLNYLLDVFKDQHQIDLRDKEYRSAYVRLGTAAEAAKQRLSSEPLVTIGQDNLVESHGRALHLNVELARSEYENMIRPLVESTLESVSKALEDAGKTSDDIDMVLLVGGSTRTPLVSEILEQRMGKTPRQDVHPDLCVALGAGLLASRAAGHEVERVLVDVCPYSFGVSYLGEKEGMSYPYCYKPIIRRNTPLPVTRTEVFYTAYDRQEAVEINIFQGEHQDAMNNALVGDFMIKDLTPMTGPNDVFCRMKLDINGILEVTAIEKCTSKSKQVTITDATNARSDAQISASRKRLAEMFATLGDMDHSDHEPDDDVSLTLVSQDEQADDDAADAPHANEMTLPPKLVLAIEDGQSLVKRCRNLIDTLHDDDRIEAIDLNEAVETTATSHQHQAICAANDALREFLFFVEGR